MEYQTKSVDELFDKFFFDNESIDLKRLVGLQYLNTGLYFVDSDENMKAFNQFEKSYFFYPTERSRFLMYNVLLGAFHKQSYSDEKKAVYLSKLCRFKKDGVTEDQVTTEFARITQKLLVEEGKNELYTKIHTILQETIADSVIRNEFAYVYHYENGRIVYNQGLYKESLPFFENALACKPNNAEMITLFVGNLAHLYDMSTDKKVFIEHLLQYAVRFPNLNKNSNFTSFTADTMLEVFARNFEKGNPKTGEQYRLMFEDYLAKNPTINISLIGRHIGIAYSTACSHYFKIGQKSKAKILVDKGLTYVPNDFQLRSRKEMLR
jgi:tetratricopeptide (TPR) repeat protein